MVILEMLVLNINVDAGDIGNTGTECEWPCLWWTQMVTLNMLILDANGWMAGCRMIMVMSAILVIIKIDKFRDVGNVGFDWLCISYMSFHCPITV